MSVNDIMNYVSQTPGNTNPNVIKSMVETEVENGQKDVVKYTPQNLTEEQKAQARFNIDINQRIPAGAAGMVSDYAKYSVVDIPASEVVTAECFGKTFIKLTDEVLDLTNALSIGTPDFILPISEEGYMKVLEEAGTQVLGTLDSALAISTEGDLLGLEKGTWIVESLGDYGFIDFGTPFPILRKYLPGAVFPIVQIGNISETDVEDGCERQVSNAEAVQLDSAVKYKTPIVLQLTVEGGFTTGVANYVEYHDEAGIAFCYEALGLNLITEMRDVIFIREPNETVWLMIIQ